MPTEHRLKIMLAIIVIAIITLISINPIAQDPAYHHFADQRRILDIDNFVNVISNTPFVSYGIKWLKISNVGKQRVLWTDVSYLPNDYANNFSEYLLHEGDVVMALTRPILGNELKITKLCKEDAPALLNQRVAKVVPSPSVNLDFIYYVLQTRRFVDAMNEAMAGSDPPNIGSRTLSEIPIALPSLLSEQRAIAEALGDVDALLDGLERLIAKKRDLKQATMQQLLTGQTRLPGFSGEWEVRRLGNHVSFLKNGVNPRAELSVDGAVKYLHYGDIHGSKEAFLNPNVCDMPCISSSKSTGLDRLKDGDLIFADASEDLEGVGRSVEIQKSSDWEIVSGLHTIAARFDKNILADGFKAYLQFCPEFRKHLRRLAAGTKVYATNRGHISSAEVALPNVAEQTAIAAILSEMDAEITALEARRDKTRAMKQGMMQELLTGRTRLI